MEYDTPIEGPTISVPTYMWDAIGDAEMEVRIREALKILEHGIANKED